MADSKQPQRSKPASTPPVAQKPAYGATRSDAGIAIPPANSPAQGAAPRYGATTADSSAATPAGGVPGSGANPYRMIALIGEGGMGQVHLAHDASLDRIIAVKRIGPEHVANERLRQRFFIEARASSRLTHFHIVQVYRLDEDQDGPFIAMEYVAGPLPARRPDWPADLPNPPLDLEDHVKLQGPLKVTDAIRLVGQLLSAVEYAHRNQIIHRDIKPANILLTAQMEPKLADFGLARQVNVVDEGRTMAGAQLLTLGYGAPEQEIDASRADHRADLYAVAATLWFALTGQNPRFFRESEVAPELRAILVRGLEKDREKRFQSAAEFAQALEKPTSQPPPIPAVMLAEAPAAPLAGGAGTCPRCGHAHAATAQALANLKFCEQCRAVLQEACPKCRQANGIWVRFCGACGFDVGGSYQREINARTAELKEVAGLVKQHEYRKALKMLDELCALRQPRLVGLVLEARRLLPGVEASYEAAKKQRDEKLEQARGHWVACQLENAAQILAQVPAPLHNKEFVSAWESIDSLLKKKDRLGKEIDKRVQAKAYVDLLPLVDEMIALDPNAEYYIKLQTFLKEYERRTTKEQLRQFIVTRAHAKEYAGLLPEVERMIALDPHADYYQKLLPILREYERQSARAAQHHATLEAERKQRAHLVIFGIISLGLNVLGLLLAIIGAAIHALIFLGLPPVSLAALGLGLFGAYKAHLRLTGGATLSELDRTSAEKARLLNLLGAGLAMCWIVGFCAVCFFRLVFRK